MAAVFCGDELGADINRWLLVVPTLPGVSLLPDQQLWHQSEGKFKIRALKHWVFAERLIEVQELLLCPQVNLGGARLLGHVHHWAALPATICWLEVR